MTPGDDPGILLVAATAAPAERLRERYAGRRLRVVYSVVEAVAALKRETPEVLICDERIEPFSADELFELVARFFPAIRCVVLPSDDLV